MTETVHRQCNLCEAHCGIDVEVDGAKVLRITGDPEDEFSRGYICPKAAALADLYEDPDRLPSAGAPRRRRLGGDRAGTRRSTSRPTACARCATPRPRRRGHLPRQPGRAHVGGARPLPLRYVLGTRNNYSATSTDQLPQHLTSTEMFGDLALFPIPDIDRTDYMLIARGEPGGVERLDHVGAGRARPAARRSRPRRQGRGRRPAAHRDRQAGRRARRGPARRRPVPPAGDAARAVRGGPAPTWARWPSYADGLRAGPALAADWPARAPRRAGVDAGDDQPAGARVRGVPSRPWPTAGSASASSRPARSRTG